VTDLFDRAAIVTVGTIQIDATSPFAGLDVQFEVEKSDKREPNTAQIKIFNLNEDHQKELEELDGVPAKLEAGYRDNISTIFSGVLREASSIREGADDVTTISSGDGERNHRQARVNRSFAPGTPVRNVIRFVAQRTGVGLGNLEEQLTGIRLEDAGDVFKNGVTVSGNAFRELAILLKSTDRDFSVQDGVLQILRRNQALTGTAILLNANTGLIDSPSISSDGVVRARTLMIPDVFPGRKAQFDSRFVTGLHRIVRTKHLGDRAGNDWYIDIEAKAVA
jgi:hypothetical protein